MIQNAAGQDRSGCPGLRLEAQETAGGRADREEEKGPRRKEGTTVLSYCSAQRRCLDSMIGKTLRSHSSMCSLTTCVCIDRLHSE